MYERLKRRDFGEIQNPRGPGSSAHRAADCPGVSQGELVKRPGVHESQASRDERNQCFGITPERAVKFLDALDARLRTKVEIDGPPETVSV